MMTGKNYSRDWLVKTPVTDDPAGELIAKMQLDESIPALFLSVGHMRTYVLARYPDAKDAADVVWGRFTRWMVRHHYYRPPI
jgi:hypothetical protein